MFQHVIVKTPCKAMVNGITDHPELGTPDYEKALAQHAAYIEALKQCGVDVTVLPPDEAYPDSCFVEDPAIVTKYCAIVTNPGADTRKGETAAIEPVLEKFYPKEKIFHITDPGTLEGGDVMMCGDTFYVGRSARTNEAGIQQLGKILGQFGCKVVEVPLTEVLHLKTGVVYLENNNMLTAGEFCDKPAFAGYNKVTIPAEEDDAAHCIWVNGPVVVHEGYPTELEASHELGPKPQVSHTPD